MRRLRPLLLLAVVLALIAAACGGDDDDSAGTSAPSGNSIPDGPEIKIGAQDFGESSILAQIYGQALDAKGYKVKYQALGGFRNIVYKSFANGDINLTPEYAASALEFLNDNAGEATPDADETVAKLREVLKAKDLTALDASPAVDSNAFVVTKDTADSEGLSSISDLDGKTGTLTLGGPPDCKTNPFCIPGLKDRYGIDFSQNFKSLDGAGPITVQALKSNEVQVAILFSTNAQIAVNNWVILKDDKGLINADNVVPVLTDELVRTYGSDMSDLLNQVSAALTTSELTELNRKFSVDKEDAEQVAKDFLQSKNLL